MGLKNIYLFIPNIIDYLRMVMLISVLFTYSEYPSITGWSYSLSVILDLFDGFFNNYYKSQGMAARKYN